ncbi:MAG: DUF763 domain-containing protein [Geminicoccaceae bacterium]
MAASRRTGVASLPLHTGRAPPWLFGRMVRLARAILAHLVAEHGPEEVLRRLSDPFWFQALGCVLGFDWHSSGVTTTVCGALKEAVRGREADFGLYVAGGKGGTSRKTPGEITAVCDALSLEPEPLVSASRLAAKVDSTAVQDGHQLYHHTFVFTPGGSWCVVQQGMSDLTRTARRYHWLSEGLASFVDEPHAAVCCDVRGAGLNMAASESAPARDAVTELAAQLPHELLSLFERVPSLFMPRRHPVALADVDPGRLHKVLLRTYERPPEDFAALLGTPGLGPKSLRALALTAEVIYGTRVSTRDPARFAFAHGGKDGTPYPVDRAAYEVTIDVLDRALCRARLDRSERISALKRLAAFARQPGAADDARPVAPAAQRDLSAIGP